MWFKYVQNEGFFAFCTLLNTFHRFFRFVYKNEKHKLVHTLTLQIHPLIQRDYSKYTVQLWLADVHILISTYLYFEHVLERR